MVSVYAAAPDAAVSPAPKGLQRLNKTRDELLNTRKMTKSSVARRPQRICFGTADPQPPTGTNPRRRPVFHANPIGPSYALLLQISRQAAVGRPELSAKVLGQGHVGRVASNPPSKALGPAQRGRGQTWCLRNLDDVQSPQRSKRILPRFRALSRDQKPPCAALTPPHNPTRPVHGA